MDSKFKQSLFSPEGSLKLIFKETENIEHVIAVFNGEQAKELFWTMWNIMVEGYCNKDKCQTRDHGLSDVTGEVSN